MNYKRNFLIFPFVIIYFVLQGCGDMKKIHPEEYFSGSQLQLAQAIEEGDVKEVEKLSVSTDLNKPGEKKLTLLYYSLNEALKKEKTRLDVMSVLVKNGANPTQYVEDIGSVATNSASSSDPVFIEALIDGH